MKSVATNLTAVLLTVFSLFACKARQADEAGLLSTDDEQDISERVASDGNYLITCRNEGGDSQENELFVFDVKGAADPADESQPIIVSVDIMKNAASRRVFSNVSGRGSISKNGSVFIGFESGVLTGEARTTAADPDLIAGIISITGQAEGLQVTCKVADALAGP